MSFRPKSPPAVGGGGDVVEKSQTNWRFLDLTLWALLGMAKKIVLQHSRKQESISNLFKFNMGVIQVSVNILLIF